MPRKKTPRPAVMNTIEAATYLRLSESTLEKMRSQRDDGPTFVRLGGGTIRYRIRDLDDYLAERAVRQALIRRGRRGGA